MNVKPLASAIAEASWSICWSASATAATAAVSAASASARARARSHPSNSQVISADNAARSSSLRAGMWTDSHVDAIARLELKDRARIASPLSECPRLTIAFARCAMRSQKFVCVEGFGPFHVSFVPGTAR